MNREFRDLWLFKVFAPSSNESLKLRFLEEAASPNFLKGSIRGLTGLFEEKPSFESKFPKPPLPPSSEDFYSPEDP